MLCDGDQHDGDYCMVGCCTQGIVPGIILKSGTLMYDDCDGDGDDCDGDGMPLLLLPVHKGHQESIVENWET